MSRARYLRFGRAAAVLVVLLLTVPLGANARSRAATGPAAGPHGPAGGQRDSVAQRELGKHLRPPAAARSAEHCPLGPSAHSGVGDVGSCLRVSADMSAAPAIGRPETLRFEVLAQAARPSVEIRVELPANLRFGQLPAGGTVSSSASKAPEDGGHLTVARLRHSFKAGQRERYTAKIVAIAPGPAQVRVWATGAGAPHDAGLDSVFFTVGQAGQPSSMGIAAPPARSLPPPSDLFAQPSRDEPSGGVTLAAIACVVGSFSYSNSDGSTRPARNWQVEAWDADTTSGDDRLAVGSTDDNGNYQLCFGNDDCFLCGGQDVYVVFRAQSAFVGMQRSDGASRFAYVSRKFDDVGDGSTTVIPAPSVPAAEMRGLQAYDEVVDAWKFVAPGDHCWDGLARPSDRICQVQIVWNPSAAWAGAKCGQASACYYTSTDTMYLSADDPKFRNIVAHEAGHAVMDYSYHGAFPATTNCNPHSIWIKSSTTCAWTEGWADWFGAATYGSPTFVTPTFTFDLESPTWGSPSWFEEGDEVEGRIAGALIDIIDGSNEGFWDRHTESVANIFQTLRSHVSNTFNEFWDGHRRADGLPVDTPDVAATLYQSTIFFGFFYLFYDPLADYVPVSPPSAGSAESYKFFTTTNFWSVVAVRPPFDADTDLLLLDNAGAPIVILKSSNRPGSAVDFVAIDSNFRPFGDYHPLVSHVTPSTSEYQIEVAQGRDQIFVGGNELISMSAQQFVTVRDVFLSAGQTVTITAQPTTSNDVELYLMASNSGDPNAWLRNPTDAAIAANAGGSGQIETIVYTAPSSGFYGLVVVNANRNFSLTFVQVS